MCGWSVPRTNADVDPRSGVPARSGAALHPRARAAGGRDFGTGRRSCGRGLAVPSPLGPASVHAAQAAAASLERLRRRRGEAPVGVCQPNNLPPQHGGRRRGRAARGPCREGYAHERVRAQTVGIVFSGPRFVESLRRRRWRSDAEQTYM